MGLHTRAALFGKILDDIPSVARYTSSKKSAQSCFDPAAPKSIFEINQCTKGWDALPKAKSFMQGIDLLVCTPTEASLAVVQLGFHNWRNSLEQQTFKEFGRAASQSNRPVVVRIVARSPFPKRNEIGFLLNCRSNTARMHKAEEVEQSTLPETKVYPKGLVWDTVGANCSITAMRNRTKELSKCEWTVEVTTTWLNMGLDAIDSVVNTLEVGGVIACGIDGARCTKMLEPALAGLVGRAFRRFPSSIGRPGHVQGNSRTPCCKLLPAATGAFPWIMKCQNLSICQP